MRKLVKNTEEEKDPPPDMFAVMFTALNIILLAFFILLKSMSSSDARKRKIAIGSLFGTFGILPGGQNLDKKGKHYARLIPVISKNNIFKGLTKEKELLESKGYVKGADLDIERTADGVKITMKAPLMFKKLSSNIDPKAFVVMDRIGTIVMQILNPIQIVGHVIGNTRVNGVAVENWGLSLGRALSVSNYFVQAVGIPPNMLKAVGRGPFPYNEKHANVSFPTNDCVIIYVQAAKVKVIPDAIPKRLLKKPVLLKKGK